MKRRSKITKSIGPNKGPGRKNKAVVKDLNIPVTKELLSTGRGDQGTFFSASGPEEVATILA